MMARRRRGGVGSLGDRDTVEQGTTPMRVVYVWGAITGVNVDQLRRGGCRCSNTVTQPSTWEFEHTTAIGVVQRWCYRLDAMVGPARALPAPCVPIASPCHLCPGVPA